MRQSLLIRKKNAAAMCRRILIIAANAAVSRKQNDQITR